MKNVASSFFLNGQLSIQVCAAVKGMVFKQFTPGQGICIREFGSRIGFHFELINWLEILVQNKGTGNCQSKCKKRSNRQVQFYAAQPKSYSRIAGFAEFSHRVAKFKNSKLALVQAEGSMVSAAHSHPKIPKVPLNPTEMKRKVFIKR